MTSLNYRSQAEAANQVEVILLLFRARENVLNMNKPIFDYRHTKEKPMTIQPSELTPLARKTRELLVELFDKNFFSRYPDSGKIAVNSYLFEIALFLHPRYKHFETKLGTLVRLCNAQRNVSNPHAVAREVEFAIRGRIKDALMSIEADGEDKVASGSSSFQEFSGDLASYEDNVALHKSSHQRHTEMIDEELRVWKSDITTLQESSPSSGRAESILQYWKRNGCRYPLLSQLARMAFAVPTSSAQIEREFGQAGNTTTPLRANLSPANLDMTSFLKANEDRVDVTQCTKIKRTDTSFHFPVASMAALGAFSEFTSEQVDQTMRSQFSDDITHH